MSEKLKIMYMGTPRFSYLALEKITQLIPDAEYCVVTKPDTPKGRSYKFTPSETALFAVEKGFPLYKPENLREENFKKILEKEAPDIIIVAAYGKILPEYVLSYPKYRCINIHGSLLPEYRGAAPVNRAIMDGKNVTGITVMKMEKELDVGEMYLKKEVEINDGTTASELFDNLALVGGELAAQAVKMALEGTLAGEKQDESLATYAHKITDADMKIDWKKTARQIVRQIHSLCEEPGAYTTVSSSGKHLKIFRARCGEAFEGAYPGEVVSVKKGIRVACTGGSVFLEQVQIQGGKKMTGAAFANGRGLALGETLI